MQTACQVRHIIQADPLRWYILGVVRALRLPDCWIGAGFVRSAVWDHLHQRSPSPLRGDVDVIWHDRRQGDPAEDRNHEAALRKVDETIQWSVKNQARMHARNGDAPYASATDAMRYWPETATAIAVRRNEADECEVAAPFGFDDLFGLILRPTPRFAGERRHIFEDRLRTKQWTVSWPLLKQADP
jgi:hypothetical protein